jgi:uncharacterized protein involved in exopolysaccharide biosynthesis
MVELSDSLHPQQKADSPKSYWQIYLILGLGANFLIWSLTLLYLKVAPRFYTSQMAINLPGFSSKTQVDVPGLGGTSIENTSPYAGAQDPRESYKLIAQSEVVLASAAREMRLSTEEFGSPRIKLIDGTTVMQMEFSGSSPQQAKAKALIFYNALDNQLSRIRLQESQQRDASFQQALNSSHKTLELAQQRLSEFRQKTGLGADSQINELSTNIEALRRQHAELVAQYSRTNARLFELTSSLDLSAKQASDALLLQADPFFQQTLKTYSSVNTGLVELKAKYTLENPKIQNEQEKQSQLRSALLERGTSLLKRSITENSIDQLNLNSLGSPSARETILRELVLTQVDRQGFAAQILGLDRQINELESRLRKLSHLQSNIDSLKRDLQIAETVFSSKLTQLDASRSNTFDSYPLIQILTEPNTQKKPSSPKKKLSLLGALFGSILISSGIFSSWCHSNKKLKSRKDKAYPTNSVVP